VCAFYCTAAEFGGAESVQGWKHLALHSSVNEKIRTGARQMRENGVPKNKACSANCRLLKKKLIEVELALNKLGDGHPSLFSHRFQTAGPARSTNRTLPPLGIP
jgi:hypothetical protein